VHTNARLRVLRTSSVSEDRRPGTSRSATTWAAMAGDARQRAVADAGFYMRLGIPIRDRPGDSTPLVVTDATIQRPTDSGPGWCKCHNGDGYGDCFVGAGTNCTVTGAPWTNNLGTATCGLCWEPERAHSTSPRGRNRRNRGPSDQPRTPVRPYPSKVGPVGCDRLAVRHRPASGIRSAL
jgi:hypothetical protein